MCEHPSRSNQIACSLADAPAHGLVALDAGYVGTAGDAINDHVGNRALP